jgi:enamine deaminase RidA (YjgF/YER057c/UK114 family)
MTASKTSVGAAPSATSVAIRRSAACSSARRCTSARGFNQAALIEGQQRQLVCSGQDAADADGNPQHAGDMASQIELAVDNLQAVLAGADMTLANVVRLSAYTTDVDELFKHWPTLVTRFGHSGGGFATSVLGVTRLGAPQLLVLLEATAVD